MPTSPRPSTRLLGMSYQERADNNCISVERADLVLAGCAILDAIRDAFPLPRLRVADRGLREGMLVEMMREDGALSAMLVRRSAPRCELAHRHDYGKRHHRPAARHGQDRRQAQAVVKALAGAPAQRSLCGARPRRDGYRSRAAYKLIEIDDKYRLLKPGMAVVDLGAAPGGWSQIAAKRVGAVDGKGKVVAIDLLEMPRSPASSFAQLDFHGR